jgi:hypothetical protein
VALPSKSLFQASAWRAFNGRQSMIEVCTAAVFLLNLSQAS